MCHVDISTPCPNSLFSTVGTYSGPALLSHWEHVAVMSGYRDLHGCTFGINYFRVCGQLQRYHPATPDAFHLYDLNTKKTINDVYVEGVSITYESTAA